MLLTDLVGPVSLKTKDIQMVWGGGAVGKANRFPTVMNPNVCGLKRVSVDFPVQVEVKVHGHVN